MKKWEYKTIKLNTTLNEEKLDEAMNELGDQGWELMPAYGMSHIWGTTREVVAVFKREKS